MSGSVLNYAIALTEADSLSVVEFQNHFSPDDDTVVKGVRSVHSWRSTVEVLAHPRNLLRQFLQKFLKSAARGAW